MKMPKAKVVLVIVGLIALSGLGGWAYLRGQSRVEYRTATVGRGDIEATISATGNPNAVVTVQVGSQVSGNIKELHADFNTKVKKGQLVARIDPEIFEAKVNQAKGNLDNARAAVLNARAMLQKTEADIANAKASLEVAKANAAKAKVAVLDAQIKLRSRINLFKEGGISAEERDSAQATYDSNIAALDAAKAQDQAAGYSLRAAQAQHEVTMAQIAAADAQVKQNEAALKQAQVDLDHTYIRAPVDGTVVSRNVDVGQTVAASFSAPTLFLIAQDLTKMQVDTNVDEADVGRIRVGQDTTFTVDAFPGEIFKGKVVQIRQAPMNVQNVITYNAVIGVANPDFKLFPGMTANVRILVDRRENVLKIPNAALRFRPPDLKELPNQGGNVSARSPQGRPTGQGAHDIRDTQNTGRDQTIWILGKDKQPQPVTVRLGLADERFTEIIEGNLDGGHEVIVGTASKNGQAAGGSAPPFGQRGPRF
ncbi:Efflux transporter, RND family, MFP subunit precursor [Candidatus Methylomirabilis oxygeniifera]|uniref:Efflux transporter, RND family, MFP subunit n=1 Tax=Methylomirabilis oxygeniifera TaxID=671143 RepID=D5MN86_METO1|nr:Efflux transporter, RND family, MFP subunit precursor [Candidatus Methylomirabilis oxyfera]